MKKLSKHRKELERSQDVSYGCLWSQLLSVFHQSQCHGFLSYIKHDAFFAKSPLFLFLGRF